MRRFFVLSGLFFTALLGFSLFAVRAAGPVDEVRPQTDSHKSRWFFFASASRPFGMVNLSPDTWVRGSWDSGYLYDSTEVRCFSHIHGWQIAGIPVMPTTGPMQGHLGFEATKSKFSHDSEVVRPGYHKLFLDRYGIGAELTSTTRVGMHRYTFPKGEKGHILMDVGAFLGHGPMLSAAIRRVSSTEVEGWAVMAPTSRRKKPCTVYFTARFNRPFSQFGGWKKTGDAKDAPKELVSGKAIEGTEAGGYVTFNNAGSKPLLMKVAISYVSEGQARLNLESELPHWDFDRVVRESEAEWNRELGRIKIEGGTERQRVKFYTDLWHAIAGRHIFSDANGKYIDNTGDEPVVRQLPLDAAGKPLRHSYNSDAFWGAEWNLNLLWSMAYPKVLNDFVACYVDYYKNGGLIARGPSGGNYTFVMVGDQAIPMIAAAYNKGIRDFDIESAYQGSLKNSEPGGIRDHAGYEVQTNEYMTHYVNKGFVPEGIKGRGGHIQGCAMTLYFAYQDWCMAQFARGLGRMDDYEKYYKRSFNYRYVYDRTVGWMRPRTLDGSWLPDFQPVMKGFNAPGFVEGNSAVFSYYVPHNLPDLVDMMGGREAFAERLDRQFRLAEPGNFITDHGKHAENWIDYENQPSLHMAHLFSHAGAPWRTQYWVRQIKERVFGDISPYGGYNGDEDQGQMGALGVLMAIGLFDVEGGASADPHYEITSPIFDRVTIRLDDRYYKGEEFVIETVNNSSENCYIQRAWLNGEPLTDFRFPHEKFAAGGTLRIELGPEPNYRWGVE